MVYLTGGTIKQQGNSSAVNNYSTGTVRVSGANITAASGQALRNESTGTITVTSGTITSNSSNAITNVSTGTILVTGGTLTGGVNGIVNLSTGTITLGTKETTANVSTTAPSITAAQRGIIKGTGTFNFYDGVIKGSDGNSISGTPTEVQPGYQVQKTTSNGVQTAILVPASSTMSLRNMVNMASTLTLNNNIENTENTLNTENVDGTENIDEVENTDNIEEVENVEDIEKVEEIENIDEIENIENTDNTETEIIVSKVVQINETTYPTISEAIASANNGDTIKLLEDIILTEEITIDEGKNIIFDLNGKTISSSSINTINNKGTLTISSYGIIKNEVENGVVIYNTGKLNIENGVITTNANGGKAIYNTQQNNNTESGILNIQDGKIVTEGIGGIAIYNVNNAKTDITGGIIETRGFGSKGIYNDSEVQISNTKVIVANDDSIGIYNSENSKSCDIKEIEVIIEAEEIENYELIKNTNEFIEELEQKKPSYAIYNDSNEEIKIETATIKVERLKGVGIINNKEGTITLGMEDETLNNASPIIYAITDYTTGIINSEKGEIAYYDGKMITINSIKKMITKILKDYEINESIESDIINTTLKLIEIDNGNDNGSNNGDGSES